ncbi:MAG: dihydroorotase [Pseudomonadota bacterium]
MTAPRLSLPRPFDAHLHLRDGAMLRAVVPATAGHFDRAIVMPNLVPPVVTATDATAYRARILEAMPVDCAFEPMMTLYLTEETDPADVAMAAAARLIAGVKLYPAGATTNSAAGVRDLARAMPVLERMAEIGLPLLVHGEVTDPDVDIFDREAAFIDRVLQPLSHRLPHLRIVMEHITTEDGLAFVRSRERGLAGTITVHHLVINRNHLLAGGIRPHYYCLPVAKRERHRLALRAAAVSGDRRFFLGTDSAPHLDAGKLAPCGCAGCFTAPVALSVLAHVFEEENALERLEGFVVGHGAAFYGFDPASERIGLVRRQDPVEAPSTLQTEDGPVTVFEPGFPLHWAVEAAS